VAGTTIVRKSSTTTRTSTTTVSDDPDLKVALAANTIYRITGCAVIYTNTTPQWKGRWNYTGTLLSCAGQQSWHTVRGVIATPTYNLTDFPVGPGFMTAGANTTLAGSATTSHRGCLYISVLLKTDAAGDFKLEWAQNTSSTANTQVVDGSWLCVEEIQ
jgi:hypothetical protein